MGSGGRSKGAEQSAQWRRRGPAFAALAAAFAIAVPLATAQPGDLDTGFGTNGVYQLPANESYQSVGAPLVQPSGRIIFAGLYTSASGQILLHAATPNGALDPSFGSNGKVKTDPKAVEGRAAIAMAPDGSIYVAGRYSGDKVLIQRFTPNGAKDTSWGSNSTTKVEIKDHEGATAIAPVGSDGALVAVQSKGGGAAGRKKGRGRRGKRSSQYVDERRVFTVLKLKKTGVETTFGTGGIAKVAFTGADATAFDVAELAAGKVLLAGSAGPDTAVARLNSNGTPDTSFDGDGRATYNIVGGSGVDFASALAPATGGKAVVSGPAAGLGMVARLNSNGSLDSGFGTNGKVVGGLGASGTGFTPTDLAIDQSDRPVVTGIRTATSPTRYNWSATRLTANANPALDSDFGTDGRVVLSLCENTVGAGPSGLAFAADGKILIAGACGSGRQTALARIDGGDLGPPSGPIELKVSPESGAAGHERIPLSSLDPSAAKAAAEDVQAAAVRHTAVRHTAVRHTGLLSAAVRHTAVRHTGLLSTAVRHTAVRHTLLSEIAVRHTTWQELLGTDAPLQSLTFEDALAINPAGVGALTLDDIDLNSTAVRHTTLTALALGIRPLSSLPEPAGGWCDFIDGQPYDCSNGADPATSTLFDLEVLGDDLSAYYEEPISLLATNLGSGEAAAPLARFRLSDLDLSLEPFRSAEASEFASILNCGPCTGKKLSDLTDTELGSATVAALVGLLPQPSLEDLSVGDVVLAALDRTELPYEGMNLGGVLGEAAYRTDGLMTYTAKFTFDCSQVNKVAAVFKTPGDARPVPGGASASRNGGPFVPLANGKPVDGNKAGPFSFDLAPACSGAHGNHQLELKIEVEPGSVLGPIEGATLEIQGKHQSVESNPLITSVDDSRDPGNELVDARPITQDALLTGHLSSATDSDSFSFTPGAGRTTIALSHLPADYDLVIYGPAVGPTATAVRHTAVRHTAVRHTPVGDAADEPTDEGVLAPDQLHDIAVRHTSLAVRASSIRRESSDEAASVIVGPEEAGETFYAQVVGYNGAFDEDPYLIRRTDTGSATPPDCPTQTLASNYTIPDPQTIPTSTKALYLAAPGRMAARDGQGPTASLMAKLDELAAETDGVVVPVENDEDVADSFTASDQSPCSPDAANAVVTAINERVDEIRAAAGGLPQLRSIVIVGPDDVIKFGRIADRTAVGNEADYADDATVDRDGDGVADDNATSAAMRQGYMLSDDPYGDFDPTESSFVPDVALGRLVETPDQIKQQIQDFLDADGYIEPERSFVTGYDFLSDGAAEIFGSLENAIPGASASEINEDWTAADAADGFNAPGAALLSVNAHYDHSRLLPAAAFNGTSPNLLTASEIEVPDGSAAFTVGCHAGLNLAIHDASSASDTRLGDLTERIVTSGSLYTANTGYGYGDDTAVAYSERILADYASELVSGDVTAGQALMLAKQNAYAAVGISDVYWLKGSMEATFYGLPMYRYGDDGAEGPAVMPPAPSGVDPSDPTTRSSTPYTADLRGGLHAVAGDRGTHWQFEDEDPLVVQRQPIQPKLTEDITAEGAPAHGFLLESLTTQDIEGVNPAIARATLDLAAHEPEPISKDLFFPANLARVESRATADGRQDLLTLIGGSFREDVQRLNLEVGGRVLRSTSDDFSPPTIRRVDGLVAGGGFSIRVEGKGDDLLGGLVLYVTDADLAAGGEVEWHRAELSKVAPGVFSAGGVLPSGTGIPEAIIALYNTSYNVAYSNRKVLGHTFSPLAEPGEGDPQVVLDPATPESGYHSGPPQVALDPGEHESAVFEVSVDGGAFTPYNGPFTIGEPAEGEHFVVFRGSDRSGAQARFAVDREGPTITAEPDRPANANGWYDGPVTFTFTCGDAVSGVEDCPDPVTLATAGRNQSASGTATDHAGHSSEVTVDGINIDRHAPTISAQAQSAPNANGWYNSNQVVIRFGCADELSGLEHCGNSNISGAPASATDDSTLTSEGRDQTVSGTARDLAGHSTAATSPKISIDRTAPAATITTPNNTILFGANARLEGTAFDALSHVQIVRVTYTGGLFGTTTQVRDADELTCQPSGSCTWKAPLPGFGAWTATARAIDFAGNTSPASNASFVTVNPG